MSHGRSARRCFRQARAGAAAGCGGAGGALAAARGPVRLLAAPGPRSARHADRGRHALSAAAAAGGPGPAAEREADRGRPAASLLPAERSGRSAVRRTDNQLARAQSGDGPVARRRSAMMDPNTVIESYVRDVTARLPGRDRTDVAMELRALLAEELAARSAAEARPADEAMTLALLRGFGSPAQAAMRYRPTPPLLDPADTRPFVLSGVIGALVLAAIAPLGAPHAPKDAATTAILAWLGLLVLVFATRNWAHRQWPSLAAWKPRDPDRANRAANMALVAVIA